MQVKAVGTEVLRPEDDSPQSRSGVCVPTPLPTHPSEDGQGPVVDGARGALVREGNAGPPSGPTPSRAPSTPFLPATQTPFLPATQTQLDFLYDLNGTQAVCGSYSPAGILTEGSWMVSPTVSGSVPRSTSKGIGASGTGIRPEDSEYIDRFRDESFHIDALVEVDRDAPWLMDESLPQPIPVPVPTPLVGGEGVGDRKGHQDSDRHVVTVGLESIPRPTDRPGDTSQHTPPDPAPDSIRRRESRKRSRSLRSSLGEGEGTGGRDSCRVTRGKASLVDMGVSGRTSPRNQPQVLRRTGTMGLRVAETLCERQPFYRSTC